ncbi:type I-E CRISPR-associated endoribonuclease Cas2e [Bifidobacterium gallicum]|uniref:CRISPR-associated protein Cas2 n=1 Tax=Bifidobacterium gallicum DSM 20093 = LMG 11596 TaxID=561180 RepID=A0A087AFV4_9BIFI|nr:type I-E CRISPR-associated endoribonuclease Cas2e [Bifidobacterium gallicum]KFI57654.1 CRISPR-associated protein Cas2 [Bifidobacterium gallicum DSM 20093 = LMG 11596]
MVVIVLTACPPGLRGDLTRWLLEISPGVFVGHVSARVRDKLWERIEELVREGRAIMVYSARNEQHLAFRTLRSSWTPEDEDGLTLVRRPLENRDNSFSGSRKDGWSKASRYHRARKFGGR